MALTYVSGVIPAAVDDVWNVVRDFNGLPDWLPPIKASEMTSGVGDQIGGIRKLTAADGGEIVERLLMMSDKDHTFTYTIVTSPLPMDNYEATMRLTPITMTGQTFAEYWGTYDPHPGKEEEMHTFLGMNVYQGGIASLINRFAG